MAALLLILNVASRCAHVTESPPCLVQVPAAHITKAELTPDINSECLTIKVHGSKAAQGASVVATVVDAGNNIATAEGIVGEAFTVEIKNPHLWSPDSPHLYDLDVSLVQPTQAAGAMTQALVRSLQSFLPYPASFLSLGMKRLVFG